jgi:hypothetical protein
VGDEPHVGLANLQAKPGALERSLDIISGARAGVRAGKFGGVILLAYAVVAIQIFGVAELNTIIALSILEASSISSLLFVIPGLTFLPLAGYVGMITFACYLLSKLDQTSGRGNFVYVIFYGVLPALFLGLLLILPVFVCLAVGITLAFFILSPLPGILWRRRQRRHSHTPKWRVIPLKPFWSNFRGFMKLTAAPSLVITNVWSSTTQERNEASDNYLQDAVDARHRGRKRPRSDTVDARHRGQVGTVVVIFAVLLGVSIAWPRPWLPPRMIQLDNSRGHYTPARGCATEVQSSTHRSLFVGYVIGTAADRLTILSLNRQCVASVDPMRVSSQTICRPASSIHSWLTNSPWGFLSGTYANTPICP